MQAPLVLNSITRADVIALFGRLAADPAGEARFLDDPAAVLAADLGWDAAQRTSAGNARLIAALRSPERRADLRTGAVPQATAISSVTTGSTSQVSSAAGATARFSTGGVDCGDGPRLDPAALRLGAR